MTSHIRRFIEMKETAESFERLFGASGVRDRVAGTRQQDREDLLVNEYRRSLQRTGGFRFTCSAIVLHPRYDRTHFNLIYATRNRKGVEVFKEAERGAMEKMEKARAEAQQRERQKKGGQGNCSPPRTCPLRRTTTLCGSDMGQRRRKPSKLYWNRNIGCPTMRHGSERWSIPWSGSAISKTGLPNGGGQGT